LPSIFTSTIYSNPVSYFSIREMKSLLSILFVVNLASRGIWLYSPFATTSGKMREWDPEYPPTKFPVDPGKSGSWNFWSFSCGSALKIPRWYGNFQMDFPDPDESEIRVPMSDKDYDCIYYKITISETCPKCYFQIPILSCLNPPARPCFLFRRLSNRIVIKFKICLEWGIFIIVI